MKEEVVLRLFALGVEREVIEKVFGDLGPIVEKLDLSCLAEEERAVAMLYMYGVSVPTIAKAFNMTRRQVRNILMESLEKALRCKEKGREEKKTVVENEWVKLLREKK